MPSWPFGLYRVSGESMLPTYRSGDALLGLKWFRPRVGQVVVADRDSRLLIKRLVALDGQYASLQGDNPARSTDSRSYGPLPVSTIKAKIIAKL